MNVRETALPGVLLIEPKVFGDARGVFWEAWNRSAFEKAGIPSDWVQDNCSTSIGNVIRGIHYQVIQPQAKMVRVTRGAVLDVAVDLRRSSPHFGRHVAVELSAENKLALYIPIGFGHGFATLTDDVGLAYKVSDYYCPAGERTLLWNDPDVAIAWPVAPEHAILADKDRNGKTLRQAEVFD